MRGSARWCIRGLSLSLSLGGGCTAELDLGSDLPYPSSSETSPGSVCEPAGEPSLCMDCARSECCLELEFCAAQENCSCFETCLEEGNVPGLCQARCDGSSGMAAVLSCVAAACASVCGDGP